MGKDQVLAAAIAELNELRAQLAADPRSIRAKKLEDVILFLSDRVDAEPLAVVITPPAGREDIRSSVSKRELIADAAEEYLRENPGWRSAAEIFHAVRMKGIDVGGQNPRGNLTAHMSMSGRFVSERSKGWRLKSEADVENDDQGAGHGQPVSPGQSGQSLASLFQQGGRHHVL